MVLSIDVGRTFAGFDIYERLVSPHDFVWLLVYYAVRRQNAFMKGNRRMSHGRLNFL